MCYTDLKHTRKQNGKEKGNKMKKYKRLLAALLVLLMCVSLFPVSAFAADEEVEPADAAEAVESAEPAAEEAEGEVAISSGTYPTLISATGTQVSATETQYNMLYVYSVSVIPGVPTQLSVTASSDSSLRYNWMSLEQGSQPQDIEGADSNTLTITCTADSTTQYMCRVYDEDYNALIVQFQLAVGSYPGLTVTGAAGSFAYSDTNSWTYQVNAAAGEEVSLWVQVGGLPDAEMADVTYYWAVFVPDGNGGTVEQATGDTTAALPAFVAQEDCMYKCNIFDGKGGVLAVFFDVQVNSGSTPNYLTLISAAGEEAYSYPEYGYYGRVISALPDGQAAMSVETSAQAPEYSWYYRTVDGDTVYLDSVTSSATVTCTKGAPRQYTCNVLDSNGDYLSVDFFLEINTGMTIEAAAGDSDDGGDAHNVFFSVSAAPGEEVTLFVTPGGLSDEDLADVTYEWFKEVYDEEIDGYTFTPTGVTTAQFTTSAATGPCRYSCVVTDGYGYKIEVWFNIYVVSGMTLIAATGEKYDDQVYGNSHDYFYSVDSSPYSNVDLEVEIGGLSDEDLADVSYQWYMYDEQAEDFYIALTNEVTENCTAFIGNESRTYRCDITDGYGGKIIVYFDIRPASPGPGPGSYVTPEPYYGTTFYRTAAGLPVDLHVLLPGCTEEDYTACMWSCMEVEGNVGTYRTIATTREPQLTVTPTASGQYMLYISSTTKRFERIYFTVDVVPGGMITTMDQDYYALAPGDEITVYGPSCPPYWCAESTWLIEDESPADEAAGAVIAPNPDGSSCAITALAEGTAFVTWKLSGTDANGEEVIYAKLRCRVDVAAAPIKDVVKDITLPNTAVTTELYSTDYSRVEILLDLENNLDTQSMFIDRDEEGNGLDNAGTAVEEAWFTDDATRERFALRVVDDRTLEIVPNIDFNAPKAEYEAAVNAVAKSYKSGIAVLVKGADEAVESSQQLTLTVKKTLPKLTAKAVKLNSFILEDRQFLSVSGTGLVTDVRLDPDKQNPDWVNVITMITEDGYQYNVLEYAGAKNASCSGKLNLLATVYQCQVECPLVVSVKAARSAPKLKVSGTVTINPAYALDGTAWIAINPYSFSYDPMKVTKITEGKTTWSAADGTLDEAPLTCRLEENYQEATFYTEIRDPAGFDSTKDRTFKVTVDLGSDSNGKGGAVATVTVKTLKAGTKPTLKLKAAGTIDTMIPGSTVMVTWTGTSLQYLHPEFSIHQYKGKVDKGAVEDGLISIYNPPVSSFAEFSKIEPGTIATGYTYYVHADLVNQRGDTVLENAAKVKLNVKWTTSHAKISTSLKASGSIDLIRPDSKVTLTPGELKNCFTTSVGPQSLKFSTDKAGLQVLAYDQQSGVNETPFNVRMYGIWNAARQRYMPTFELTLKDECRGVVKTTDKFFVFIDMTADGQHVTTKPVQIKLTKGSAKITPTVKTVQLLKNDRFSYADIGLIAPDGCTPISDVTLDAKSDARFDLVVNGGGNVELHRDPTNALTTKATVKLNVYLKGNTTGKPDAVVSVAVKFA